MNRDNRDGKLYDDEDVRDRGNFQDRNRPMWRTLEIVVKENAAVEVSILDLKVPRFSFRVGTAHFPENDTDSITVDTRLTIFNVRDAVELLSETEEKYTAIREAKIEKLEERKRKAIKRAGAAPEVIIRRNTNTNNNDDDE
jgi:hypothetical protein